MLARVQQDPEGQASNLKQYILSVNYEDSIAPTNPDTVTAIPSIPSISDGSHSTSLMKLKFPKFTVGQVGQRITVSVCHVELVL